MDDSRVPATPQSFALPQRDPLLTPSFSALQSPTQPMADPNFGSRSGGLRQPSVQQPPLPEDGGMHNDDGARRLVMSEHSSEPRGGGLRQADAQHPPAGQRGIGESALSDAERLHNEDMAKRLDLMQQVQALSAMVHERRHEFTGNALAGLLGSRECEEEAKRIGFVRAGADVEEVALALLEVNKLPLERRPKVLKKLLSRNSELSSVTCTDVTETGWKDTATRALRTFSVPHVTMSIALQSGVRWHTVQGDTNTAKYRALKVKIGKLYDAHLWLRELGFGDTSVGYTESVKAQSILKSLPEDASEYVLSDIKKVAEQVTTVHEVDVPAEYFLAKMDRTRPSPSKGSRRKRDMSPATCFNCGSLEHLQRDCTELPRKRTSPRPPYGYAYAAVGAPPSSRSAPGAPRNYADAYMFPPAGPPPPDTPPPGIGVVDLASLADGAKCYGCGNTGHRQSDCPSVQCFNCQQFGHYANDCRNPPQPRSLDRPATPARQRMQGRAGGRGVPRRCPRCPGEVHTLSECPNFRGCEVCGSRDHPTNSHNCPGGNHNGRRLNGNP